MKAHNEHRKAAQIDVSATLSQYGGRNALFAIHFIIASYRPHKVLLVPRISARSVSNLLSY